MLTCRRNQRAVNDGRWKLHIYPQINHQLLFDLESDPHETNNLLGSHPEKVKELTNLIEKWRQKVGDKDPLSVIKPQPLKVDYTKVKRVLDVWQPKWIRDKYFAGRDTTNHGQKSAPRQKSQEK